MGASFADKDELNAQLKTTLAEVERLRAENLELKQALVEAETVNADLQLQLAEYEVEQWLQADVGGEG